MEVLRTTEILENEINENAKKKAACILAEAESECRKIAEIIDKRIAAVEKEEEFFLQKQLSVIKMEMEAAISLSKVRFLAEYTNKTVISAIHDYLDALDEKKQLQLIQSQLSRFAPVLEGKKLAVEILGFDEKSVRPVLADVFGKDAVASCQLVDPKVAMGSDVWNQGNLGVSKGILLRTEDSSVRCHVTFDDIVGQLLERHGSELASTLFCGGLSQ